MKKQIYFVVGILVGVIMMISVSFSHAGQGQKKQYRKHNNQYERVVPKHHGYHHRYPSAPGPIRPNPRWKKNHGPRNHGPKNGRYSKRYSSVYQKIAIIIMMREGQRMYFSIGID